MLVDYLSKILILEPGYIRDVAKTSYKRYRRQVIKKANGEDRVIYQPSRELKILQRVIHDDFLVKLPIHESATAYKKGASVLKNATVHKGAKYLLRVDLKDFFRSIRNNDIRKFVENNKSYLSKDWDEDDTDAFIKIVSFKGGLNIGSITSPMLANTICYQMDCEINGACQSDGVIYTRYADDLFFSSQEKGKLYGKVGEIIRIVKQLDCPSELRVNVKKTVHISKKNRMEVTNLVLTNDGNVSIGRDKKRKVRSSVYKWSTLQEEDKTYLSGYLAYCRAVEPGFINDLCNKYGASVIREILDFN